MEDIPKNSAKIMRATLVCLFTCVCNTYILQIDSNTEKRNPKKNKRGA